MTDCNADRVQELHPSTPREQRARKLIHVEIERENRPSITAIVTNLSEQGMGGKTTAYLEAFEQITIIKNGYGRISGEVRWTDGEHFGVLFAEPVNIDLFNFTDDNKRKPLVQRPSEDQIWRGFTTSSSTRRPGVTSRFSKS